MPVAIVREMQSRWAAAFDRCDWPALAALYHPQAQLFGGKPDLYEGSAGVLAYFQGVKPGAQVLFGNDTHALQLAPDLVVAAVIADFRREGKARPHRLTWTLGRIGGEWKIASHHASPQLAAAG